MGFRSIRVGVAKHGVSLRYIHFVANDPINLNSTIKACLINFILSFFIKCLLISIVSLSLIL